MSITPTRERVIFALFRKDGQLNKELIENANTNHNSLSIVLRGLKKDNIIVKDKDNRYRFSTKLENNILKALGSAYTVMKTFDRFGEDLEKEDDPFKKGLEKISEILRLQVMLRLERYGVPKLTKRDRIEFEMYFEIFDMTLQWIFDILRKKNEKKTEYMKAQLIRLVSGKEKQK